VSIVLWGVSASRSMMTTYGIIYVTPYAIEEHFDGSKIGFRRIGWQRRGIGIMMQ
jgi:hypothetical protein